MTGGWHKVLVIMSTILILVVYSEALVGGDTCGQTITKSTTLTSDLICLAATSPAINIVGSDITLNLGGHTLRGITQVSSTTTGIMVSGSARVTITNGTIQGFGEGIGVFNSSYISLNNLSIRNLGIVDPDHYLAGVHIHNSLNVVIEDSQFEFQPVIHKDAVIQYHSGTTIRNNHSNGGMVGISFHPVCDNASSSNHSEILGNTFTNAPLAVWVACTNNSRIAGNTFTDCNNPIQGDAPFPEAVTGLTVEDNIIHTTASPSLGIQFRGVTKSTVLNNTVKGNDAWGITIGRSLGCIDPKTPGWECFYSTNNLIRGNVALENGIDLFHDTGSTPNTWENNTCRTRQGADIPSCFGAWLPWLPLLLD